MLISRLRLWYSRGIVLISFLLAQNLWRGTCAQNLSGLQMERGIYIGPRMLRQVRTMPSTTKMVSGPTDGMRRGDGGQVDSDSEHDRHNTGKVPVVGSASLSRSLTGSIDRTGSTKPEPEPRGTQNMSRSGRDGEGTLSETESTDQPYTPLIIGHPTLPPFAAGGQSTNSTNSNMATSTMVAIGAGTFFFLLAAALTVFCVLFCRPLVTSPETQEFFTGNPAKQIQGSQDGSKQAQYLPFLSIIKCRDLKLATTELTDVERGVGFDYNIGNYKGNTVMVKSIMTCNDSVYFKKVLMELKIISFVGKHPYVLEFLGAVTNKIRKGTVKIVMEYSPYGNLTNYIQDHALLFNHELSGDGNSFKRKLPRKQSASSHLSLYSLYFWAEQIADGLQYLHSKQVVHGELCGKYIYLFDNSRVKISEFAKDRYEHEYHHASKKQLDLMSWRWLSIETLKDLKFNKEADLWSFGVLLWEIFSLGKVPYQEELEWSQDFEDKLTAGSRLSKPEFAPDNVYKIMYDCWDQEPKNRPDCARLKDFFYELRNDLFITSNDSASYDDTADLV